MTKRVGVFTILLMLVGTLAGQRMKIPVIFDMHEHYVEVMQDSFSTKRYRMFKPFSAPLLWALANEENERIETRWSESAS